MIEDAELLRRYVEEKSETAFSQLVERHLGLVYATALRRVGGDSALAEDITQQVFVEVARRAALLRRRPVLAGWLFTSARFAASKAVRSARRRREREQEAYMQEVPAETVDWEQARGLLDDALADLAERDREAVLLRFVEGRDFSAIGARFNLTANAARMRVDRALDRLRDRLARRGLTSTAAVIGTVLARQAAAAVPSGLMASVTQAGLAAGAAAAGSGASVVLTLMSMSKVQVGVAGGLLVAAGIGLVIQSHMINELRTEVAALQRQTSKSAPAPVAEGRISSPPVSKGVDPAPRPAPDASQTTKPAFDPKQLDWSSGNPALDQLAMRRMGWSLLTKNEGLVASLHLPEESRRKVRELLLQREHDTRNLADAASRAGLSVEQRLKEKRKLEGQYDQALLQALGPDEYARYQEEAADYQYRSKLDQTGEWVGFFLEAGSPLSREQSQALYSLLRRYEKAPELGPNSGTARHQVRDRLVQSLIQESGGFLSGAQQAALRTYFELDQRMGEEFRRLKQAPVNSAPGAKP